MSVARLLITVYFQHYALYSMWIFLWMDGSAADSAMSCKQFSIPDTETTVFKGNGCFLLSREERTWEESNTFCNGLGDGWSLVEIEDVETQKHVDSVSRTAGVSTGSWIGLRQRNGIYAWVSGNKLGYTDFFNILADGEVMSTGDCVITSPPDDTSLYGIWNCMDCTARLYSICHSVLTPGSPLPPRKTTTSRRTTSSAMTLNATPVKPPTTVKYGATQSTAATTQSSTRTSLIVEAKRLISTDTTATISARSTVQTTPGSDGRHDICVPLIPAVIVALLILIMMGAAVCVAWKCSARRALMNRDKGQQLRAGDGAYYVQPRPDDQYHVYDEVVE